MQTTPKLVLILGMSATGKTRLARDVSANFNLPLVCRDDIKEIIFDKVGWSDREHSKKVGGASFAITDYFVEEQLKSGHSIVLETPLKRQFDNQKFQQWQRKYGFNVLQILCFADGEVVVERFVKRNESGERHPGHRDEGNLDEFRADLLKGKAETLDLKGEVIEIDTTNFKKIDYPKIYSQIAEFLEAN